MNQTRDFSLYDWQEEAVCQIRMHFAAGRKRVLLVAPTGSGKTEIGGYMIKLAGEKEGSKSIFACDRLSLIEQTFRRFRGYGIDCGVIQANHWATWPWKRVQVASAQTLARRSWPPDTKLLLVDEAHTLPTVIKKQLENLTGYAIGLTATPFTKGLGKYFDAVVTVRTTNQLIQEGRLANFRTFAPSEPDMTGVKKLGDGEWDAGETEKRCLPIIGDVVTEYLNHGQGKKFIAFGATIRHCEEMRKQFMASGIVCELFTANTTDQERAQILEGFAPGGHIQGLLSVAALAKGFDAPWVEVVIMARPLRKSLAEHIQILGRGLRHDPANPGKVCTVLDHAGNMLRFWADMQDFFEHSVDELDDGKPKEKKKAAQKEREPMKCPKCAAVHAPRPMCPACGHEYPKRQAVHHQAGRLAEFGGAATGDERQRFFSELLGFALERPHYKPRWADAKFRAKFGTWPDGLQRIPAPPSRATRRWIQAQNIAWAKAQEKAAA